VSCICVEAFRLKFVTDAIYGDHLRGIGHPERPERVEVVASRLRRMRVLGPHTLVARDATDEELERVHTREYLELVTREVEAAERGHSARYLSTGDVVVDGKSLAVARRAAGGAIVAVEAAVDTREPAFALVRPPGHHAEPNAGMGFCIFNNVAVAARAYQARSGGAGRVLVADFDYHHGNGTQAVAGNGLSYVSTHAAPAYPGTGNASYRVGDDVVFNVPLPASGISTEEFVAIWERLLPLAVQAAQPDLMIVSAGFDYVEGDPVGDLGVAVEAAENLGAILSALAAEYCEGRIAYVLEGGYDLGALTTSIALIASATGKSYKQADGHPIAAARAEVLNGISELSQGSIKKPQK
jgi:acetoin utilization deacetylase AcuC-like enzyme